MSTHNENTAQCPKCKEAIQPGAVKCKHCGADLRNWFLKHKFITGFLILVVLGALINAMGGGSDTKNNNNNSNGSAPKVEEQKTEYAVGETITFKNHQMLVNSYKAPYSSGNMFDTPQSSDNEYVLVNISMTNSGTSDLSVNQFGFKLEDESGVQRLTALAIVDSSLPSVSLSPGGTVSGNIVFEAKKASKTLKLKYSPGILGGSEATVNLK